MACSQTRAEQIFSQRPICSRKEITDLDWSVFLWNDSTAFLARRIEFRLLVCQNTEMVQPRLNKSFLSRFRWKVNGTETVWEVSRCGAENVPQFKRTWNTRVQRQTFQGSRTAWVMGWCAHSYSFRLINRSALRKWWKQIFVLEVPRDVGGKVLRAEI